jgi:hypothetical protein
MKTRKSGILARRLGFPLFHVVRWGVTARLSLDCRGELDSREGRVPPRSKEVVKMNRHQFIVMPKEGEIASSAGSIPR